MILVEGLDSDNSYKDFARECKNNETYKRAYEICKKYGYKLASICYVEESSSGKLTIRFAIEEPLPKSMQPSIYYSKDGFSIRTKSYTMDPNRYEEFIQNNYNASAMLKDLQELDLTKLHRIKTK